MFQLQKPLWLVKLLHFEYWTWWFFYLPLLPWYIWQAIRAKSFTFFTNVDPCIDYGGFFGESKIDILRKIPAEFTPKSIFIQAHESFESAYSLFSQNNLEFPIICKPNIGERGNNVEKIMDLEALEKYHQQNFDYIIQEYIDFPVELGVLYYKMPHEKGGNITSIAKKGFLQVIGDGENSIETLLRKSDRARFQIARLKTKSAIPLQSIPAEGVVVLLEPIGNHCRGTAFFDFNHLINNQLTQVFDQICSSIHDFHYGRFDLRVPSIDHLLAGKNIMIMELNGVSADPGHIYDPNYKLLKAYSEVAKHWEILANISIQQQKKGIRPIPIKILWPIVKAHFFNLSH